MDHQSRSDHVLELVSVLGPGQSKQLCLFGREISKLRENGFDVTPGPKVTGSAKKKCIVRRFKGGFRKEYILEETASLKAGELKTLLLYGGEICCLREKGFEVNPIPQASIEEIQTLCIIRK